MSRTVFAVFNDVNSTHPVVTYCYLSYKSQDHSKIFQEVKKEVTVTYILGSKSETVLVVLGSES